MSKAERVSLASAAVGFGTSSHPGTVLALEQQIEATLRFLGRTDVEVVGIDKDIRDHTVFVLLGGRLTDAQREELKATIDAVRPAAVQIIIYDFDGDEQERAACEAAFRLGGAEAVEVILKARPAP
jgi:hypothetical protein